MVMPRKKEEDKAVRPCISFTPQLLKHIDSQAKKENLRRNKMIEKAFIYYIENNK